MNKSDYNKVFGNYIKNKREAKGWSQTDLASLIGNNSQNISRIERGEVTPTIFWLEKLADAFECKVSELLAAFEIYREAQTQKKDQNQGAFND